MKKMFLGLLVFFVAIVASVTVIDAAAITVDDFDPDYAMVKNNLLIDATPENANLEISVGGLGSDGTEHNLTYFTKEQVQNNSAGLSWVAGGYMFQGNIRNYGGGKVIIPDTNDMNTSSYIQVRYPQAGTYNGEKVSAVLTFSNLIQNTTTQPSTEFYFSNNLYGGYTLEGLNYYELSIEFFYLDSGDVVSLEGNSYITFASLNGGYIQDADRREYVGYENMDAYPYYLAEGAVIGEYANRYNAALGSVIGGTQYTDYQFSDQLGSSSFYKSGVSFQVAGDKLNFYIGAERQSTWTSIFSATVFGYIDPVTKEVLNEQDEDIDETRVTTGDTLKYKINQRLPILGSETLRKYESLVLSDMLTDDLEFTTAYLVDENGNVLVSYEDTDATALTNYGEITYEETTNTVTFTATSAFVQLDANYSQNYSLVIETKVLTDDFDTMRYEIENSAVSTINNFEQTSNMVMNYLAKGKVTEYHVDTQGNNLTAPKEYIDLIDQIYNTAPKEFDRYELISVPSNATGPFTEADQTVTYVYKPIEEDTDDPKDLDDTDKGDETEDTDTPQTPDGGDTTSPEKQPGTTVEGNKTSTTLTSPYTGDTTNQLIWGLLAVGAFSIVVYVKRKQSVKR